MSAAVEVSPDGSRLTVRLPLTVRKRGGRKVVVAPQGDVINPPRQRLDSTLVKAIARAYRWQRLLEQGAYASMRDLAAAEAISPTYISRLLRLTLLAPGIVEAVLDGRQPEAVTQELLFQPLPDEWHRQHQLCSFRAEASQTAQALGATDAVGDYLDKLIIVVATAATAQVQIKDGADNVALGLAELQMTGWI